MHHINIVYKSCLLAAIQKDPLVNGLSFGNSTDNNEKEEYKSPLYQEIAEKYGIEANKLTDSECWYKYVNSKLAFDSGLLDA